MWLISLTWCLYFKLSKFCGRRVLPHTNLRYCCFSSSLKASKTLQKRPTMAWSLLQLGNEVIVLSLATSISFSPQARFSTCSQLNKDKMLILPWNTISKPALNAATYSLASLKRAASTSLMNSFMFSFVTCFWAPFGHRGTSSPLERTVVKFWSMV